MSAITAGIIMGAASLVGSVFGGLGASSRARREAKRKAKLTGELTILENNRQAIINPYSGISDISSMAKNLSGMVSNPFASLGVATNAAEIQIEEADIALANTLDTLRSTGASAGGATALAQAALQSKKGVAASIENQEAANEKLKAEGQSKLEQIQMGEAGRVQNIQMSEAQRMQQADVSGKSFVYGEKERRETEQLNRKQAQITGAAQAQVAARQDANAMFASGISSAAQMGSAIITQ
tara:strand:+ start:930 stop:1649 length:720 start_codon:yes stop_codon:yes gene_type:complete